MGDQTSAIFELENGTPQGSTISPLLFLLMINDISVKNKDVALSLFADDSALYKAGNNLDTLIKDIQTSLDEVSKWCERWGFKISVDKSCGIVFTNKTKIKIINPLTLTGSILKMENKVKFLGLIFDKKLNWSEHIDYIIERCNKRLNLMRMLAGSQYGASKRCLLTIYKALIRSVIDYGAIAYDSASRQAKKKLDVLQAKALRISAGAMKATSLCALQNECGELPLALRRKKQLIQYSVKVNATTDHPAKEIVQDHPSAHSGKFNEDNKPFYSKVQKYHQTHPLQVDTIKNGTLPPWLVSAPATDTSMSSLVTKKDDPATIRSLALDLIKQYQNCLAIYTDASKAESGEPQCPIGSRR